MSIVSKIFWSNDSVVEVPVLNNHQTNMKISRCRLLVHQHEDHQFDETEISVYLVVDISHNIVHTGIYTGKITRGVNSPSTPEFQKLITPAYIPGPMSEV